MSVGISLAIIGSVAFGGAIAWLAWEAFSAPTEDRWADFKDRSVSRDQQYRDRIASGSKSFREALALSDIGCAEYAANNDKPVGQFVKWPEVTEEDVALLHEGKPK